jgi:hypothetical protein
MECLARPEFGHSFSETTRTEGASPDAGSAANGETTRSLRRDHTPRRMTSHALGELRHFAGLGMTDRGTETWLDIVMENHMKNLT